MSRRVVRIPRRTSTLVKTLDRQPIRGAPKINVSDSNAIPRIAVVRVVRAAARVNVIPVRTFGLTAATKTKKTRARQAERRKKMKKKSGVRRS